MCIRDRAAAAKVIACTALDFMTDEALLEKARKDYLAVLNGETYRCPLPEDLVPGTKA